jgi:hypothetical protein
MKRITFKTVNSIGHVEYRNDAELAIMKRHIPNEAEQEDETVEPLYPTGIETYKEGEQEEQELTDEIQFMLTPEAKLMLSREKKPVKEITIVKGGSAGVEPLLPNVE